MIPAPLLQLIDTLSADGRVSAEEALAVRRAIFPDGVVSRGEAEALFVLNERVNGDDPAWNLAFAEAIADCLIEGGEPRGHVTLEGASWLAQRITRDGMIERDTELEVVLKILERAESAPDSLSALARDYVSRAILAHGAPKGRIGEAEAALLRRVLHAGAGAGATWVTRAEADWLFSLDEATLDQEHDPAWRDIFVKGLLNHFFAPEPSQLLAREGMAGRADWLAQETPANPIGFLGRAASGGLDGYFRRIFQDSDLTRLEAHYARRNADSEAAEAFTLAEAAFLTVRMRKDKRRSPNEAALMEAIQALRAGAAAPAI